MGSKTVTKQDKVKEIAANNPAVDAESVSAALTLVESMRRLGLAGPHYGLASPYGGVVSHSNFDSGWVPEG